MLAKLNIKTFREDSDRIKTKISDLGYAFVQVTPDLKKDKVAKSVEVIYHVSPGEKVYIRNVIIEGNNRTLDRIIRRELYLGPGDSYSINNCRRHRRRTLSSRVCVRSKEFLQGVGGKDSLRKTCLPFSIARFSMPPVLCRCSRCRDIRRVPWGRARSKSP